MRILGLALAIFMMPHPAFAPQQLQTGPEWIVVYTYRPDPLKDPITDIRVVIRADSEGDAVMKSILYLEKHFDGVEKLKFVEVAAKKP